MNLSVVHSVLPRPVVRQFAAILTTERRLLMRQRRIWLVSAVYIVFGLQAAAGVHQAPLAAWDQLANSALVATLVVIALCGEGFRRERSSGLDAIIAGTPVEMKRYMAARFVTVAGTLLALSLLYPLSAVVSDHLANRAAIAPLGARPYFMTWWLLMVTPLLIGLALMQLMLTAVSGQRLVAVGAVLLAWALPALVPGHLELLDVSAVQMTITHHLGHLHGAGIAEARPVDFAALVRRTVPPVLPPIFAANRLALLLSCAALVLMSGRSARRRLAS